MENGDWHAWPRFSNVISQVRLFGRLTNNARAWSCPALARFGPVNLDWCGAWRRRAARLKHKLTAGWNAPDFSRDPGSRIQLPPSRPYAPHRGKNHLATMTY